MSEIPQPETAEKSQKLLKNIKITIESYENINGVFPVSDLKTECKFLENELGQTEPLPITNDAVLAQNYDFFLTYDMNSSTEIEDLISNPIIFTVYQIFGTFDISTYKPESEIVEEPMIPFDSAISLYEAFTGDQIQQDTDAKPKKSKDKKMKEPSQSKIKTPKKGSTAESKKSGKEVVPQETIYEPVVYGVCTLDLLPLFYGNDIFAEKLSVNPLEIYDDDRMIPYKRFPKMVVKVECKNLLQFCNNQKPVIMNVTVESIYNLPNVMSDEMEYEVCMTVPFNSEDFPVVLKNPKIVQTVQEEQMKCWPGIHKLGNNANTTKYKIKTNCDDIKNRVNINLNETLKEAKPRLEFNYIKRMVLEPDDWQSVLDHITRYKRFALEIFARTKPKVSAKAKDLSKISLKKGTASDKSTAMSSLTTTGRKESQEYLHLMAVLDLSSLIYPCTYSVRIASQLSTYHDYEASNLAGLKDSYFMPKPKINDVPEAASMNEKQMKSKHDLKDKSSKAAAKKGSEKKDDNDKNNLKYLFPKEPEKLPEPEPSTKIYNEEGKPTFVIVEIEFSEYLMKKRDLEDLSEELSEMVKQEPVSDKVIVTNCTSRNYYREVLNELTQDLSEKYKTYFQKIGACCCNYEQVDFMSYLKSSGDYEQYLSKLSKAALVSVTNNFHYGEEMDRRSHDYQKYVGEVFAHLVAEMHVALNHVLGTDLQPEQNMLVRSLTQSLFYANDALARGEVNLAEQYYLERICYDESNANSWFDYAIYLLEVGEKEKAFQCCQRGLTKDMNNVNCLLLYGILLADKNRRNDAELSFLTVISLEENWLEGWGVLCLFYQKFDEVVNMENALDKVTGKLQRLQRNDYFSQSDDIIWTRNILPHSVFMNTAAHLLKMRLYDWAEMALSREMSKHYGQVQYLLAAICYYKKLYNHAMEHIQEAKDFYGSDYAVGALAGHIQFALGEIEKAKEEYYHVLEAFACPDNLHFLYVNCSRALEILGRDQEARKVILYACKLSPTPETWYRAGRLYYRQCDFLSGEECLSEANRLNNTLPEIWGYLTLTNLKLERIVEAEFCYRQAMRNKLNDLDILQSIKVESNNIKDLYNFPC